MITRKLQARVKKANGEVMDVPVSIELAFDEDNDPLSVQIIITEPGADEDVVWIVSRELLAEGSNSYKVVGSGDIRFRYLGAIYSSVMVCLRNATGHADISLPHADVVQFVEDTVAVVPLGDEDCDDHIDDLIREILA